MQYERKAPSALSHKLGIWTRHLCPSVQPLRARTMCQTNAKTLKTNHFVFQPGDWFFLVRGGTSAAVKHAHTVFSKNTHFDLRAYKRLGPRYLLSESTLSRLHERSECPEKKQTCPVLFFFFFHSLSKPCLSCLVMYIFVYCMEFFFQSIFLCCSSTNEWDSPACFQLYTHTVRTIYYPEWLTWVL